MILGLTCISEELKDKDKKKFSFRTMTRKRFNDLDRDEAIKQLSDRILHNAITTRYIINYCSLNNILHYRLSSALFPLITDDQTDVSLEDLPDLTKIKEELSFAGKIAEKFDISIGSHPDQFNVLASTNRDAVARTINELNFTIENEDKGFFNVDNCIKFSEYLFAVHGVNIPVCYDNLHDFCNPSEDHNVSFQAERCAYTWVNQGSGDNDFLAPVFHWSEGTPEKPRSHAEYFALGNIPPHIAIDPNKEAKWECEVKGKDKAIRLLRKNLINACLYLNRIVGLHHNENANVTSKSSCFAMY